MLKRIPLLLIIVFLVACAADETIQTEQSNNNITVNNIEANLTSPTDVGSIWLDIRNTGDQADQLIGASLDGCGSLDLYDMVTENGVMEMREVAGGAIDVPAGETTVLSSDGLHIMCYGKSGDFAEGDSVEIMLEFANAGMISATGTVVVPEFTSMDHGDMDHGDDEAAMDHDDHAMETDDGETVADDAHAHGDETAEADEHAHGDDEAAMDHDDHAAETDDGEAVAEDDHAHGDEAAEEGAHAHGDDAHGEAVALGDELQLFQIAVATYLMDNAGFHALDDQLNEDGDPPTLENAAMITHIRNALAGTEWSADLQTQVDELIAVLDPLTVALQDADMETAAPLATDAHERQHDLSHTVAAGLEAVEHAPDPESEEFLVAVTQLAIDKAGFHGLDVRLNEEAGDVLPLDALMVRRVQSLVAETAWPAELSEQAGHFEMVLNEFVAALEAGDAAELAAEAHTVQHDFSAEISHYLGLSSDH